MRIIRQIDRESFAESSDSDVILKAILIAEKNFNEKIEDYVPSIINLRIKIRDINDNSPFFSADFQVNRYYKKLLWVIFTENFLEFFNS